MIAKFCSILGACVVLLAGALVIVPTIALALVVS